MGDIIVFVADNEIIGHRIVKISEDEYGLFFTTKGDNNDFTDEYKIRASDIRWVAAGVLY